MTAARRPGEALPPAMVKLFRNEARLNQDEFAQILGLRGGKASVSAWETGRVPCEGPVAELILLRFGREPSDVLASAIRDHGDRIWDRAAQPLTVWRQVVLYPQESIHVAPEILRKVVPEAALTRDETAEGFPFFDVRGFRAAGLSSRGWVGVVPVEQQRDPQYMWLLDEEGRFLYRERFWEDDQMSPFHGAVAVPSLLRLSLRAATFMGRVYRGLEVNEATGVTISCEIEGMYDRGFAELSILARPPVSERWKEPSLAAVHRSDVGRLMTAPLEPALALVAATVRVLDSDMAARSRLLDQLRTLLNGADWAGPDPALIFARSMIE